MWWDRPTYRKRSNDSLANDSNFGSAIDIAAPGVRINSTWNNGSYNILDGTSMAAPLVMGALAVYKIHQNNLSSHDLIAELLNDSTSSTILCNGDNRGTLMVIVMILRNRCYSF
jgi:subtilisin family serine protease